MNNIITHARNFSYCNQSHASWDEQHLRRFMWASQLMDGASKPLKANDILNRGASE